VALWVFGGGGGGLGGPGGSGLGAGAGKGAQSVTGGAGKKGESERPEESPLEPSADSFRVEILSDSALQAIAGDKPFDLERCYRVEGKGGAQLLTLPQLKEFIKKRRQENPSLRRLEIVLYKDSPAPDNPYVSDLENWAHELPVNEKETMKVDVSKRDQKSPTR
jgi:hypothetical protein